MAKILGQEGAAAVQILYFSSREELKEDIKNAARCSRVHLAMAVLSTIVAIVGLRHNNVTVIIGAMVIAPYLGPNVPLALATTLGALAFTTGASATLIGLMVAVAFLPPLVTFGLLLGGGQPVLAMGALSLFLVNLICVNLAGVTTFLVQGIHPATWWEKDRAAKATRVAIGLGVALLAGLVESCCYERAE